jgi:glycosyltransferase involved in cell wall biosynthesis
MKNSVRVLWFRPNRWDNVSVRRERITEKLEQRGIEIDLIGATTGNFLKYGIKLTKGEYDIVIGNVRLGLYGGYPLARLTRTPFIADVSDPLDNISHLPSFLYTFLAKYEKFILRHSDANVFLPETIKGMGERGIDGKIAGNAVDFDMFANPDTEVVEDAGNILRTEGVSVDKPLVVYIGSMPRQLHFEEIIEAARVATDWQFVIIGEGPMADTVAEASEEIYNLFFPGAFDYELMPGFLNHADAALCLEDVERPLKISEYGAANLPTLGAYGKLEEEFPHDEIFYVEPDADEIAQALRRIDESPKEARARANRLQEHAERYSWDEVASTYYELIDSLAGESYRS